MNVTASLKNQLLIAMPDVNDALFHRTVIYLCEHSRHGAMGLVINAPLKLLLGDLFKTLDICSDSPRISHLPLLSGGPIQQSRGFVLHAHTPDCWQSTLQLNDTLAITTSKDILSAIAQDEGPSEHMIALGYVAWGAGQLEKELLQNIWLSAPASSDIIFRIPCKQRWHAAAAMIGIQIEFISQQIGHA